MTWYKLARDECGGKKKLGQIRKNLNALLRTCDFYPVGRPVFFKSVIHGQPVSESPGGIYLKAQITSQNPLNEDL